MNIHKNIWIGLAHVTNKFDNDILGDSRAAYVNILAIATSMNDYHIKAKDAIEKLGLECIEIEEIENLLERSKNYRLKNSIIYLANEVIKTGLVQFGNFHTFKK
ncbi:MAG: hypothetical protein U0X76_11700 [Bacteroidia bacterium]